MTAVAIEPDTSAAAADEPRGLKGWIQRRVRRRQQAFGHIPAQAYAKPIHRQRTVMGLGFWLNDPGAIKHVLVDNVGNYPKMALETRFLAAMIGDGLLTTDGETWRTHRRIMAPSFDPRSVTAVAPVMAETALAFRAGWDALPEGAVLDAHVEMTRLTLEIIGRAMFSTASCELAALIDRTVRQALEALNAGPLDLIPILGAMRGRRRERTLRAIFAPLDAALERLIAEREAHPRTETPDLLDRLIAAKDSDTGARMTAKEVRDQVITIFLAGHETTAVAMTWTWYLLAQNPAAEARLHAELDEVLAGRAPTADDVARLPYARRVIDEALRLYPPAPGVSNRQAVTADVVGGQAVPKGGLMFINTWVLHRNPRLWPDPERFDPDRFLPERSQDRPRYAYLPFGAGPRVCIGAALSLTEAVLILATLAQRYRLERAGNRPVELQQIVTLRPRGGLPMMLHRR